MYVIRVVVDFFFFKQKTAYEMRISDWSSDVCSSDLPAGTRVLCDRSPVAPCSTDEQPVAGSKGQNHEEARRSHGRDRGRGFAREIGRASCRERVGPYV